MGRPKSKPGEAKTPMNKRSPTAHRSLKQMREHADSYGQRDDQQKNRAARMRNRRAMEKEGKVSKNDGRDIDHKRPLSKGGSNARSNLRVTSRASNRGHGMSRNGRRKG